ncbi:hypothetical protein GCM10023205_45000 [Yinghuangia aomiensis]|uniref:DUF4189 domain-containing protein n=1 Tax=Yinghuangia aomiensis TaxID=676205 RepID=A0ABP9HL83_9ACTN
MDTASRTNKGRLRFASLAAAPLLVAATACSADNPARANAGDCVHVSGFDANSAKKVACTDASANYLVIQKFTNTSDTDKCDIYKDRYTDLYVLYQIGDSKYVLCLKPTDASTAQTSGGLSGSSSSGTSSSGTSGSGSSSSGSSSSGSSTSGSSGSGSSSSGSSSSGSSGYDPETDDPVPATRRASPPAPTRRPDHYGAIAVASNGANGRAWDYPTASAAQTAALNNCPGNCKVLVTFVNSCGAVAYNSNANRYWGGKGDSEAEAQNDAISNAGGGRWIAVVCTTRYTS